ncbi:hypothetical protein AAG570_011022 [Ranatra chinensis]|uniref:DOMON domain-containing protein n=1 Tax=Ranatra chinensis TaxID=642074 RepID=A0ABD0YJF4_9HEMI
MLALWLLVVATGAVGLPSGVFRVPLDPAGNTALFWSLHYPSSTVHLEAHVPSLLFGSWFALGFSDYGLFTDADFCLLWADPQGNVRLQDSWTDDKGLLWEDEQQDCDDLRYVVEANVTKFSFSRQFDTCDVHDYCIEEGTTHIVWAKGGGGWDSMEGMSVQSGLKGMQRVQLLKNLETIEDVLPEQKDVFGVTVTSDRVKVPSLETTYWCHVTKLPQELSQLHHIVKFESVIQEGNEGLVHHMELFHCEADRGQELPLYRGPCQHADRPNSTQVCKKVLAAWAMGASAFHYPKAAGLPVGGENFNLHVMLEVHYNNPEMKADWVDSSGLRIYLTKKLRRYNAGVIELGLEYIDKMAIPPKQPAFNLTGYCIAQCTAVALPEGGVTVFGSQLHTHLAGTRVATRHLEGSSGREMPLLNWDNHYSTHFQEIRLLKRPVTLMPGDALITTCTYNTQDRDNITLGGFAISDEMCVNYIYYYPKVDLEVCKSSISDQALKNYFDMMKTLEGQRTGSELPISQAYGGIEWNPVRTRVLAALYEESPIYMQCNSSSGARFPGNWEAMPLARVTRPLPPASRPCPP